MLMRARRGVLTGLGNKAYGAAFLTLLALALALSVAVFQKRFVSSVDVTLLTNRIGSQLQESSDVKMRGLIVGEVKSITTEGDGARLVLALQPDQVGAIPRNVLARLLPKTLFGERFVDLVVPPAPTGVIAAGDTIGQDRTSVAIELEKVFDDLLPLLQTVQPEKLSATLNALASTLDGRGRRLGENLVLVDRYFQGLNPSIGTIQADISGLADLASTYSVAAPDLVRMLKALLTTNATIVEKQAELAGFLAGTAGFANTATGFLSTNQERIIQLGRVQRPTLELLARYSPEYPCLVTGLVNWIPRVDPIFSSGSFRITLEMVPQRPAYQPGEEPAWGEHRGPSCMGLPNPGGSQANPRPGIKFNDGTKRAGTASGSALPSIFTTRSGAAIPAPDSGLAGTAGEQQLVAALMADGGAPGPSAIQTLLAGPILRGTVVNNR